MKLSWQPGCFMPRHSIKEKNLELIWHPSKGQQNLLLPSDNPLHYLQRYHFRVWSMPRVVVKGLSEAKEQNRMTSRKCVLAAE